MGLFGFGKKKKVIASPNSGEILPISESSDKVFADKMMGDGFLIKPENDEFVSPVNGVVSMVFETKHAIGFKTQEGVELLIHIGIDTVKLNGEGFNIFVSVGDKVKIGDKIGKIDLKLIQEKGYLIETPVVITNFNGKEVKLEKTGTCVVGDEIIYL